MITSIFKSLYFLKSCPIFDLSPLTQFSKFNNCWFLGKNLSNFVPLFENSTSRIVITYNAPRNSLFEILTYTCLLQMEHSKLVKLLRKSYLSLACLATWQLTYSKFLWKFEKLDKEIVFCYQNSSDLLWEKKILKVSWYQKIFFLVLDSSKKRTKNFCPSRPGQKSKFSSFLEELKTSKGHFEINWHLATNTDFCAAFEYTYLGTYFSKYIRSK